jgi:hypothetical protein
LTLYAQRQAAAIEQFPLFCKNRSVSLHGLLLSLPKSQKFQKTRQTFADRPRKNIDRGFGRLKKIFGQLRTG